MLCCKQHSKTLHTAAQGTSSFDLLYPLSLAARPQRDADWERMTAHSITEEIFDAAILGLPLLHIFWSTIHQQNILLPLLTLCCGSETNASGHVLPHSYCVYKRYTRVSSLEYDCQQLKGKIEHGVWWIFLAFVKHLFTRFANSRNASVDKRFANPGN